MYNHEDEEMFGWSEEVISELKKLTEDAYKSTQLSRVLEGVAIKAYSKGRRDLWAELQKQKEAIAALQRVLDTKLEERK